MVVSDSTLYESVAKEMSRLIEKGTYRAGDRLPSVRGLARQLNTSITTIVQAYRLLENKGIIEARPQSGFFVRPTLEGVRRGLRPEPSVPALQEICIEELYMRIMKDVARPDVLTLSAAIPTGDLVPVAKLRRSMMTALRRWLAQSTSYDLLPGCEQLRRQISQRLLQAGVTAAPEEIVTTCGAQEAIRLALGAVCRPGDVVAVDALSFSGTLHCMETMGLRALELPLHIKNGLDLEALQREIDNHQIKAVFSVPSFSNPLGCLMPEDSKRELVRLLSSRKIPLIEDDIYGDLCYAAQRPKACKAFDQDSTVIYCSSFSKTIAPGYRVGYMIPGRYQHLVERHKLVTNVSTALPTQLAIAEFLATGGYDAHLRRIRRIYSSNLERYHGVLREVMPEGTELTEPCGGMALWVELPTTRDTTDLYRYAIGHQIAIAPGACFSASNQRPNAFRIVYTQWSATVERGLRQLGRLAGDFVRGRDLMSVGSGR